MFLPRTVIWFFLFISALAQAEDKAQPEVAQAYQLMLIGSELPYCRSSDLARCNNQQLSELASSSGRQEPLYRVSPVQVRLLMASYLWHSSRQAFRYDLNLALSALTKRVSNEKLSAFQLITRLRAIKVVSQGRHISGYSLFSQLSASELQMLLDYFELPQVDSFTNRIKEVVKIADKQDQPTILLYKKIVEQAQLIGQHKQPNILLVTAAQRDPFKDVDSLSSLFNQLGAQATWLPLDSALAKLIADGSACDLLPRYRNQEANNFQRNRIYPDLVQQQEKFCAQPSLINDAIAAADAVVFIGRSPTLLRNTFVTVAGQPSLALQLIESKMLDNKLFVASIGGATLAMTGHTDQREQPVVMIVDGDSEMAFIGGTSTEFECNNMSPCIRRDHRRVYYNRAGGLGLFTLGVIDTKISRDSNFARLAKVSFDSNNKLGFGLDSFTGLLVRVNDGLVSLEVTGEGGATIVDHGVTQARNQAMELTNISLSYLTPQDKAEISKQGLTIFYAKWKQTPLDFEGGVAKFNNLFRSNNFFKFTQQACITKPSQWLGRAGKDHQFKITLNKSPQSTVMFGGLMLGGAYKIYCSFERLELNITRK